MKKYLIFVLVEGKLVKVNPSKENLDSLGSEFDSKDEAENAILQASQFTTSNGKSQTFKRANSSHLITVMEIFI